MRKRIIPVERIIERYKDGVPVLQICYECSTDARTIYSYLRQHNIPLRSPSKGNRTTHGYNRERNRRKPTQYVLETSTNGVQWCAVFIGSLNTCAAKSAAYSAKGQSIKITKRETKHGKKNLG